MVSQQTPFSSYHGQQSAGKQTDHPDLVRVFLDRGLEGLSAPLLAEVGIVLCEERSQSGMLEQCGPRRAVGLDLVK